MVTSFRRLRKQSKKLASASRHVPNIDITTSYAFARALAVAAASAAAVLLNHYASLEASVMSLLLMLQSLKLVSLFHVHLKICVNDFILVLCRTYQQRWHAVTYQRGIISTRTNACCFVMFSRRTQHDLLLNCCFIRAYT